VIELQGVYKDYAGAAAPLRALHPVDLSIGRGEVFGVIGHSGAGKSTLLRTLNLLERPSGGRLLIEGRDVTSADGDDLRALRRRIGMIFQHFNLLSSQDGGAERRASAAAGRPPRADRARVRELLGRVGLQAQADKYPASCRAGRSSASASPARWPPARVLLCDEATSALDPETTAVGVQLLGELNRELGLTIVLITHEMEVIRRVCDRVAVLDAGRLVGEGTVADVFLHPQHADHAPLRARSRDVDERELRATSRAPAGRVVRLTFRGEAT
jgi:D-methionine transport system ATP-binding protein